MNGCRKKPLSTIILCWKGCVSSRLPAPTWTNSSWSGPGTLKNQIDESREWVDPSGLSTLQQLSAIAKSVHKLVKQQYRSLKDVLQEMEREQLPLAQPEKSAGFRRRLATEKYFDNMISPVYAAGCRCQSPLPVSLQPQSQPWPDVAGQGRRSQHRGDSGSRRTAQEFLEVPRGTATPSCALKT